MVPDMREDISSLREELTAAALHRGSLPFSLRDTLHPQRAENALMTTKSGDRSQEGPGHES